MVPSVSREFIEKMKRELGMVFKKVFHEDQKPYEMFVALNTQGIIICVKKTLHAYYAKIARAEETMLWNCLSLEENPRGLYVFAQDEDALIDKVLAKITRSKVS